jgi:parallel beta-helix repeat protein
VQNLLGQYGMPSLGGCLLSRTEPGFKPFALVALLLLPSCAPQDGATLGGGPGALAVSASVPGLASNYYYVAPTGNDSNPCSAAAPCFTMQRVSRLLAPGDVAHFAAGTYAWGTQQVSVSGTASARITYLSDKKWGAKISGSCPIMQNTGDYVDIIGFDMTGTCATGLMQDGNYGRVIGNRVHDLPGTNGYAGILVDCCKYYLTGNQVIGNVVDNVAPFGGTNEIHGIYVAGPHSVIENNIVTRASAACIHLYHGATNMIISNNVVANCGRYGIAVSADAAITTAANTTVDNNIVVNVASSGGYGYGLYEYPATGANNVYNNNIVYNNPGGNVVLRTGTQSGTITLTAAQFNALFMHYTGDMNGDYHLRSSAVGIDAGTTSCAAGVSVCVPSTDFDGYPRPYGAAYDIGAYECSALCLLSNYIADLSGDYASREWRGGDR